MSHVFEKLRSSWPADPVEAGHWRGALIGSSAGAVATWLFLTWSGWVQAWETSSWIEIAGVFATSFAAIVALCLGLYPILQAWKRERLQRDVVGWLTIPHLGGFRTGCLLMREVLQSAQSAFPDPVSGSDQHKAAIAISYLDVDQLIPHVNSFHLSKERGVALARILYETGLLRRWLTGMRFDCPINPGNPFVSTLSQSATDLEQKIDHLLDQYSPREG